MKTVIFRRNITKNIVKELKTMDDLGEGLLHNYKSGARISTFMSEEMRCSIQRARNKLILSCYLKGENRMNEAETKRFEETLTKRLIMIDMYSS